MRTLLLVWMICGWTLPTYVWAQASKADDSEKHAKELVNSIGMKFVLIPSGTYTMGLSGDNPDRRDHAIAHEVTISKSFYLGVYEVTQSEYEKVMGNNPSAFQGDRIAERDPATGRIVKAGDGSNHPVDSVSWNNAVEFCKRLSELPDEKLAQRVYRLPTEAEWEYACRAGTDTNYSFGDSKQLIDEFSWHFHNSYNQTHPVGRKKPNPWGLYDMHGNVWEWCSDWRKDRPERATVDLAELLSAAAGLELRRQLPTGPEVDPTGPMRGSSRVHRGGSWGDITLMQTSIVQYGGNPDFGNGMNGFRVAISPPAPDSAEEPDRSP